MTGNMKASIVRPGTPMTRTLLRVIGLALIASSAIAGEPVAAGKAANPDSSLSSGIELRYADSAVRPQDDFYRAVNGKWLDTFELPPDKPRYGTFDKIREDTELQLKAIIEDVAKSTDVAQVRGLAPLRNQPGFYEAFGVKEGDKMYLSPDQRVVLW